MKGSKMYFDFQTLGAKMWVMTLLRTCHLTLWCNLGLNRNPSVPKAVWPLQSPIQARAMMATCQHLAQESEESIFPRLKWTRELRKVFHCCFILTITTFRHLFLKFQLKGFSSHALFQKSKNNNNKNPFAYTYAKCMCILYMFYFLQVYDNRREKVFTNTFTPTIYYLACMLILLIRTRIAANWCINWVLA